jgi:hypothetical protein
MSFISNRLARYKVKGCPQGFYVHDVIDNIMIQSPFTSYREACDLRDELIRQSKRPKTEDGDEIVFSRYESLRRLYQEGQS